MYMTTKFDIVKLKIQAALGSAEAMFLLAQNYFLGIGVEVNFEQAHKYLEKAVNKDFSLAKECMEHWFADNGKSVSLSQELKDHRIYETFQRLCQEADKGVPEALHLKSLGKLSNGIEDFTFFRAIKEQKLACRQGYAPSLFSLGLIYYIGNRIKGKQKKGLSMIMQSAEENFIPAIQFMMSRSPEFASKIIKHLLEYPEVDGEILCIYAEYYKEGLIVEKNINEYIRLLKMAATKKCAVAAYNLGLIYELGLLDIPKDINEAIGFYELGVSLEDADCMLNLGHLLEKSDECPHDLKRAFELYHRAAQKGNAAAFCNLGICYKRGIGTEKDKEKALECYVKAAGGGNLESFWNLYLYYMDGSCTKTDFSKAVEWLKKGDQAGSLNCSFQLAKHIENGDGIEWDAEKYFFYVEVI